MARKVQPLDARAHVGDGDGALGELTVHPRAGHVDRADPQLRSVDGVPGSRGARVEFCDLQHQAIAFVGTCPLCRRRSSSAPVAEGEGIYASDLRRIVAETEW